MVDIEWLVHIVQNNLEIFIKLQKKKGVVHQIISPISNSESTIFFNEYFLWFLFQLTTWDKTSFGSIKSFISFSSSNTQFYESRIFCLFTFWVFFPDKSFKLIYTQKCQYILGVIHKRRLLKGGGGSKISEFT